MNQNIMRHLRPASLLYLSESLPGRSILLLKAVVADNYLLCNFNGLKNMYLKLYVKKWSNVS